MDNTKLQKLALSSKLEGEGIVDSLGKDGNASMPEQVKWPNSWRKMTMMMRMPNF
jgi:hypothetical protein